MSKLGQTLALAGLLAFPAGALAAPCEVADNGTGTVTLPPIGCQYLSPGQVHMIVDGLPPGTTIELDPIHEQFFCNPVDICSAAIAGDICEVAGGTLGGNVDCFESTLHLEVQGTGDLAGFNRSLSVPVASEVHTGPRNPGDPVQTFTNDMFRLEGELFGDPDFCVFRVRGGTDFGLPSSGQTTLTDLGGGTFNVDSFFDITYQIEFVGCPGGPLDGLSGTTIASIHMEAGEEAVTTEACCLEDGTCIDTIAMECPGTPQGPSTTCATVSCPHLLDGPCIRPDNGTGTVDLPPEDCDYLSPSEVHKIIDGLPPGTEIELAPIHNGFMNPIRTDGGTLGGEIETFESSLELTVGGTGELTGFVRDVTVPVDCEVHTGPRNPGDPVQTFDNVMFRLTGELVGDPDFCVFRVSGGSDLGLPSPGQTRLTQLPSGDFAVDSFFDITYQIEFAGCPGSQLDGMSGTTTATIRMETRGLDSNLLITEVVDGDLVGGKPKWVELTNCGDEDIDLAEYRLAIYANGLTTQHTTSMAYGDMSGTLAPGDSFVIANPDCAGPDGEFVYLYGFEASLYDDVANGNGNDVYALYYGVGIDYPVDIYGRIGEAIDAYDYSMDWAYQDSYAYSMPGRAPNGGAFDAPNWFIAGNGSLSFPDYFDRVAALQNLTTPLYHACRECEAMPDGSGCSGVPCPIPADQCQSRCMNFDPATGASTTIDCDCRGEDECHVEALAVNPTLRGAPCTVPDNGSGTVTLPPQGCEYLSPDNVHQIIDGLPAGTTIELAPIHKDFICSEQTHGLCTLPLPAAECEMPGGSLGGNGDCFESTLNLALTGTGDLAGYSRQISLPVNCEVHTGPRNPGDPVQTFANTMYRLDGELLGDPDFCVFRVRGGEDFGLPSPGQTTLTELPSGDFAVDSFFDITYQIEFEGCPGGPLDGMSGTTTAAIRMETESAEPPICVGGCPEGFECFQSVTTQPDGTLDICCDCVRIGDCTGDGIIDLADFAVFNNCIDAGGPSVLLAAGCDCVDMDKDADVDLVDFLLFQAAFD